jgi:membrane-associated phospholipid phosphatase
MHSMDRTVVASVSGPAGGTGSPRGTSAALEARLAVAGGLALLGCGLFAVDVPVAAWCRSHRLPGDLARLIDLSEVFAHGLAVAVLLGVATSLDPVLRRARSWPAARLDLVRLVAAAYAGGLAVDLVKAVVTRVRPRAVDLAAVATVFDTFGATAAMTDLRAGPLGKSADLMSFPSGHAAVAAGLATALAWKYPHAAATFALLAVAAAVQRVVSSAHYPSDVAFGAAIGVAVAALCLGRSRPALAGE